VKIKNILFVILILTIGTSFLIGFFFWYRKHQIKLMNSAYDIITHELISKMDDEKLVQQLFMAYIPLDNKEVIKDLHPGAVFVHTENIPFDDDNEEDIEKLKRNIHSTIQEYVNNDHIPPIFAIDQEGGFVRRLKKGVTAYPSFMAVREAGAIDENAEKISMISAFHTCRQLKEIGIYWNLSPVVDTLFNTENSVIGTRSFSNDPQINAKYIESYLDGIEVARCLSSLKHFPGHGSTGIDSHIDLPVVNKSIAEIEKTDLYPFLKLIKEKPEFIPSIMTSHILFENEAKEPVSLSSYWINDYLKNKLKYDGIVITDDLLMGAVQKYLKKNSSLENSAFKAVKAGNDMILLFSKDTRKTIEYIQAVKKGLEEKTLDREKIIISAKKIIKNKLKTGMLDKYLQLALKEKYPWAVNNEDAVTLILQHSISQERYIWQIENQLTNPDRLNEKISKNAVKLLKGSDSSFFNALHSFAVYTDIQENNPLFENIKNVTTNINPLKKISQINDNKSVVILHTSSRKFPQNIKKWLMKKDRSSVIIFTCSDPFPYSSLGEALTKDDILITAFSNTIASQKSLVDYYINAELPKKAVINYSKEKSE